MHTSPEGFQSSRDMPPAKRLKTSPSDTTKSPVSVKSQQLDQTPRSISASHEDESKSKASYEDDFDPALLDEEEVPNIAQGIPAPQPNPRPANIGGYNALKSFNGQMYSGMAVGGSHTWNYDPGIWRETKTEPDLWKIDYETKKRRAKNAPTGSGASVGTEYHWLVVAHQYVKKIDANTYETHLVGSKYKLAHKGAGSNSWSINTVKAQREHEIELLEDAKRRVQGLPPVLSGEKVKAASREKGQQKLDSLFVKSPNKKEKSVDSGQKRKREEVSDEVKENTNMNISVGGDEG
ncbi:hypothetical protein LTR64_000540 [Lithohypha guttulata]|uniref:uncharacterized protein n=1 Tax=Lithohypha guttulata TaxID=1690604 RepID=UPI002DDE281A|nr:hypothetical protein LTR51_005693 [Lithohypha guttulata]